MTEDMYPPTNPYEKWENIVKRVNGVDIDTLFVKESSKKRSNVEKDALENEAEEEHQKFLDFCHVNQIHVYRLIPGKLYEFVPFEPVLKITSTPAFNCIFIEQIPINLYEGSISY